MKTLNRPKRTLQLESEACSNAIESIKAGFEMTSTIKSKIKAIQEEKDEFDKALELIDRWERGE